MLFISLLQHNIQVKMVLSKEEIERYSDYFGLRYHNGTRNLNTGYRWSIVLREL